MISRLRSLGGEPLLGQSLAAVVISFGLRRDRFALQVRLCCRYFPLSRFLFLAKMLDVNTSLAGKLRIYLCPLFVYRSVLIFGQIDLSSINLPSVQIEMDVRMLGISMDGSERNSFWKGLFEKLVCDISNLRIGSCDVERQNESVMSPSALRFFKLLHRAEMSAQLRRLFREP